MQEEIKNKIKEEAKRIFPQLIEIRRELHMYPELGFEERRTASLITDYLKSLGVAFTSGVAKTGVVGLLPGKEKGKVVALRADMDGLPLQETANKPYRSRVDGLMHACGHDAHVAILLGTATILAKVKDLIKGAVKFIFQPAEEKMPSGAEQMLTEGVLENPKVEAIFALHSEPRIAAGKIGYRYGPTMAQPLEFEITIIGKEGHGAAPHLTVDPIVVAAEAILALQKIASRMIDPTEPVVLTIGKIAGGTASNIIPPQVNLVGTLRILNPDLAKKIREMMTGILNGITSAYGAQYRLKFDFGSPVLINDPQMTTLVKQAAEEYLGADKIVEVDKPNMGGEDFACYLKKVPGVFFRLGTRNPEKPTTSFLHSSTFDIDEDALQIGAGFMAYLALRVLQWRF